MDETAVQTLRAAAAELTPWQQQLLAQFWQREKIDAGRWYRRRELAAWLGRRRLLPYHVELLGVLVALDWLETRQTESAVPVVPWVTWYRLSERVRAVLEGRPGAPPSAGGLFLWGV